MPIPYRYCNRNGHTTHGCEWDGFELSFRMYTHQLILLVVITFSLQKWRVFGRRLPRKNWLKIHEFIVDVIPIGCEMMVYRIINVWLLCLNHILIASNRGDQSEEPKKRTTTPTKAKNTREEKTDKKKKAEEQYLQDIQLNSKCDSC